MSNKSIPQGFDRLLSERCIAESDILHTEDHFCMVYKSLSEILAEKAIYDFPNARGERLACCRFYDDWFLYAVGGDPEHTYSLLKLREQEHDAKDGLPADGDTPGVTISFISFDCDTLFACLAEPSDENRRKLDIEINRVVAYRGQRHHAALKKYFKNPQSRGAYLAADVYVRQIASFAEQGCLAVPDHYKEIVQQSISYRNSKRLARLPNFVEDLNRRAGYVVCDNENIYIKNKESPTAYEAAAILATHTGNTSVYSFAAEVEFHAGFLTPLAKIKVPFFGKSIYESAIRADMTVGDTEFDGPAPFYQAESNIVKRQYALHRNHWRFG